MRARNVWIVGAMVTGLMTLVPSVAGADAKPTHAQWSQKMQSLYKTLSDLMTDVTSSKRFNDPANNYRIEDEAEKIATLAHDLSRSGMVAPDADPSVQIIAGVMAQETRRAATELKKGNRAYARTILRSVPGYCIACHTRNQFGPRFDKLPIEPMGEKLMTDVEKGEFFAATRQFDRAEDEFIKVVESSSAVNTQPLDWAEAVHQGLATAVRVDRDPELAMKFVSAVLNSKDAPFFVKQDAKSWKASIDDWQKELPRLVRTEDGLHAELLRLMDKARNLQKYPADRSGDIDYFRASSLAHDLLQLDPNGKYADEAMLMAGLCYEVLSPIHIEDLHELYYEACVRRSPHTEVAEVCYRRFEQSTFFDYTGSAGMELPEDARAKLLELGGLAAQKKPSIQN